MTDYQDQYTLDPAFRKWVDVKVEVKHGQTAVEAAALRAENAHQRAVIEDLKAKLDQYEQSKRKR